MIATTRIQQATPAQRACWKKSKAKKNKARKSKPRKSKAKPPKKKPKWSPNQSPLEIHGEMMALSVNFSEFPTFLEVFVDPEDFELADTMTGILGCDVHDVASQNYEVRCSLPDGATAVPDSKQETFGFDIPAAPSLLHVTLDGSAATLDGSVGVDILTANIPWQWVINLFHDDEGEEVEVCEEEPPCEDCEPSCWTEWVDGPEAPEVEGTAVIFLPGAGGSLAYNGDDDVFQLLGLTLGEESAQVLVDEATLVAIDLNPEAGRTLNLSLLGEDLNLLLQASHLSIYTSKLASGTVS